MRTTTLDLGAPTSAPTVVVAPSAERLRSHPATARTGTDTPWSALLDAARQADVLPAPVHEALLGFADAPGPGAALLVRGLPVGDLPATPAHPTDPTGKDHVSELVVLAAARRLGQPVGYRPEHGGAIVQTLVPTRADATAQTSTSSAVDLAWHTETAFHRHKPRHLLLLCLRGDPAAATLLATVTDVLARLSPEVVDVLRQPRFRTRVDASFSPADPHARTAPAPVIGGRADDPTLWFDEDLMEGDDPLAEVALTELGRAVHDAQQRVVLDTGDLLVVDNDRAVHGRSPFRARFDGTDRWLQRAFVVPDLTTCGASHHDRVLDTVLA
ncbi:MAG TPA: TauD/TfdA family dioxygenase [Acidimicrobiales bacterium]|nr:TauD/TfdA family dioxygenase [Acidimicrobiales bacterium]